MKKFLKYVKLVGILTLVNYALTALVCLFSGKLTPFVYSNTLWYSTGLVALLTLITYIYGFVRKTRTSRNKMENYVKSKEEIEADKDQVLNISFILFALAMTSLLGSAIAAAFA